ncbi:unnamed protein product [Chironomus riparius]|uniref:Rhodanese domain-containing protein n=1 Tax=Chironomus riparius TaxID=315576 RepID=A0A9N9RTX8_9DIPT|nr:unnamed protein product [Chironomus riparius]
MKIICSALFFVILINYSVQMAEIKIATYEEIKDLPNHPEKLLIDVREPQELESTGRIPTSINIPLDEVRKAFSDEISEQEFELMYGVKKPKKDDYLIFSCRTGRRSLKAINEIIPLGYWNVKNYRGSWTEYATKEGLKVE